MTTVGAAASAGSGTAALLSDSESFGESTVTAGVVDLETDPSWGNDGSLGTISQGESGSRTVEITLADNPSYVWFRTDCKQCTAVEDALYVRYGIDTDGDGESDLSITDGYITLGEARERYGTGYQLGTLDPSKTWTLIAEWELREPTESTDVSLSFDFYATQTRHVSDPGDISLPWSCEGCNGSSIGTPTTEESVISWVSFCGDSVFEPDFTPVREGTHTLLLDTDAYTVGTEADTIVIKYGTTLEVFHRDGEWPSSLTVGQGDGEVFQQTGNNYDRTSRTNSNFCDGEAGCKFEFDDGGGGEWECKDGAVLVSGGDQQTSGDDGNDGQGGNDSEGGNNGQGNNRLVDSGLSQRVNHGSVGGER